MPSVAGWDGNPLVKHMEKHSYYNDAFDFPPHILDNDLLEDRECLRWGLSISPRPQADPEVTQRSKNSFVNGWVVPSSLSILSSQPYIT